MKLLTCFAALIACQSDNQAPPTFPLRTDPRSRAHAFLISPMRAITALHSITSSQQQFQIAGAKAHVKCKSEDADLALLELDRPLVHSLSVSFASPRKKSVCYALSPALHRLRLNFRGVESAITVYYASRIPVFVFSAPCTVLAGWSGSPVVTAQNELVGVLVQARENIVHVVPSRFVVLLHQSQQQLNLGYIPALCVSPAPSASRTVTVDRDVGQLRKGDVVLQIGTQQVHQGFVTWQGLRAPLQAAVVHLYGTKVQLKVLRNNELKTICVIVRRASEGCAAFGRHTGICVHAGSYKMATLSLEMLESFGAQWQNEAPPALVELAMKEGDGSEVIVVVETPKSRKSVLFQRVMMLNGIPVRTAKQLNKGGLVTFENGDTIRLPFMSVQRCDCPL
eukprot:TRINITY_DN746_c0_g1_i1.p1 TRINITY_DN746_c0_g1~~TRINITY_DN746_c0_g1_i1.p1  ORF type:complete len:395 (-),score=51.21 TRINITY_DN746_c0_g1_i1:152-1336(-)